MFDKHRECAELKDRFSFLKPIKLRFFKSRDRLEPIFLSPERIAHRSLEK